jgi:La domain
MNHSLHNDAEPPRVGTSTKPEIRIDDATTVGMDKLDALYPLRQQIEYYFGAQNLPRDTFLQQVLSSNHGLAPIRIIANFPKVQALYRQIQQGDSRRHSEEQALETIEVILYRALQDSDVVTVTDDGYYLRPYWGSFLPNSGYPPPPHIVIDGGGRAFNVSGTMDMDNGPPTVATISPTSFATTTPSEHDSQTLEEPMPYRYESMAPPPPPPHHSYFAPTFQPSAVYGHAQNTLYSNWSSMSMHASNHSYYPPTGYYSTGPTTMYPSSRYDDRYLQPSFHALVQAGLVQPHPHPQHPLAYAPADAESKASNEGTSQVPWPLPRTQCTAASAHGSMPVTQYGMVALDMHVMPPPPYYVYAPSEAGPPLDHTVEPSTSTSSAAMNHRREPAVPNQSTNRVQQSAVSSLSTARLNKRDKQHRGKHSHHNAQHASNKESVQHGYEQHDKVSPSLHILPEKSRDMEGLRGGGSGLPPLVRVAYVDARGSDHLRSISEQYGTAPMAEPPFYKKKNMSADTAGNRASATANAELAQPPHKKKRGKRVKNKLVRDKVSIASLEHFPVLSKKDATGSHNVDGCPDTDASLVAAATTKVKSPTKRYSDVLLKTTAPAKNLRAESETAPVAETTPVANLQGPDKNIMAAGNSVPCVGPCDTTKSEQNGESTA